MLTSHCLRLLVLLIPILCIQPAHGQSWRILPALPDLQGGQRYEDVFFLNARVGWVVRGSDIHRTTDGGNTWQTFPQAIGGFRSVVFVDSLCGWVGGLHPGFPILSTSDGGATVQAVEFPESVGVCGLSAPSADVIYGCGRFYGPAMVIKSTDGGQSWTTLDLSHLASRLVDCYFTSVDSGFVFGGLDTPSGQSRALVLSTTDAGTTWGVRHLSVANRDGWCWKVSFPSDTVGYASVEFSDANAGFFLKTVDAGTTWSEIPFDGTFRQQGIGFATENLGWIGGGGSYAYRTTDGGVTWQADTFGRGGNSFHMLGPGLGYLAGREVSKYSKETAVDATSLSRLKSLFR